jgi:RNA polymerase sigma factor (sigma-70 family)
VVGDWRLAVVVNQRDMPGDEDLVRLYLHEIGRYSLLTKDEEASLARRIETGRLAKESLSGSESAPSRARQVELERMVGDGDAAQQAFVQSNLRLVVSIAKRYRSSGLPLLDLVQEGNLGLIHAVEKFDWRRGFKFSTYATWWIRQAITRGVANSARTIRLPVHVGDRLAQIQRAEAQLEAKFGRSATRAELRAEVGLSDAAITDALRLAAAPLSLFEPLHEDSTAELSDVVEDRTAASPFESAAVAVLPREIVRLLAPLEEREREILRLRFGLGEAAPKTLNEVGEVFHLTRERIRQIESRALSKLRHPSSDTGAHDLLGE